MVVCVIVNILFDLGGIGGVFLVVELQSKTKLVCPTVLASSLLEYCQEKI